MMDWDDLRFFLAVARGGSLSAAGRGLGVKHTTVLRRIGALESQLGIRLFERLPSGYVKTPAGEEMEATARQIEESAFDLERRLTGRDLEVAGELRVTASDVVAQASAGVLAEFRARHPAIRLELQISSDTLSLSRREADVAIRVAVRPAAHLVGRRLRDVPFGVWGSSGYLDRNGAPRGRRANASHFDWVVLDESSAHFPQADWERRCVPPERVALRSNSSMFVNDAVRAGFGVALMSDDVASPDPSLRRALPNRLDFGFGLWLLTHADLRRMPRVRAFLDFVGPALALGSARLSGRARAPKVRGA
jgi:DNA-binding transcriptional LysR family regulator